MVESLIQHRGPRRCVRTLGTCLWCRQGIYDGHSHITPVHGSPHDAYGSALNVTTALTKNLPALA